ncbi:YveK family protein [Desulfolucanica intricata]|uniref:YveK family protein n=1 Tax=Desulfolucanica intricata TaxID=1285191 RepID=UPI00083498FF|nr:GNVR domain-containing protein [Desulfolucanica intricata]
MRAREVINALNEMKIALIAVPVLAMVISAVISLYVIAPVYRSSTTLMVFRQPSVGTSYDVTLQTIMLNQKLVKSYTELAKSTLILNEVIKQNNLKMSAESLRQKVNVELLSNTELFKISVEDSNPTLSAMLANEMARVLSEKVAEMMNFDNIQIVDAASPPGKPIWPNHILNVLLAGVIGTLIILGIAFMRASIRDDEKKESQSIYQPVIPNQAIIYPTQDTEEIYKGHEDYKAHKDYNKHEEDSHKEEKQN